MSEELELAAGPSDDEEPNNLFNIFLDFLLNDKLPENSKNGREYKKLFAVLTESEDIENKFVRLSSILDNLLGGWPITSQDSSIQPNQFSNEPEQNADDISENEEYNRSDYNVREPSTQNNQSLDESEQNDVNISEDETLDGSDYNMRDTFTQNNESFDDSEQNDDYISEDEEFNRSDDEVLITNRHSNVRANAVAVEQEEANSVAGEANRQEKIYKLMALLEKAEYIESQFLRLITIIENIKKLREI